MLKLLVRLAAIIQVILGIAYLFMPDDLLKAMGHHIPPTDIHYPLAMLGARFLAYGAGLWIAAARPVDNRLWIRLMAMIQAIDLGAGIVLTVTATIPLTLSFFPMFNSLWIGLVCGLWPLNSGEKPVRGYEA